MRVGEDDWRVWREVRLAVGWPPGAVDGLLAYYTALRAGWAATPHPDLGMLLGRPATGSLEAVRQALGG
jgi:hypothetical protein